jgi:hypothetical protein
MTTETRLPNNHVDFSRSKIRLWAEEAIWGHRFYDDQTPWLVVLEFLNVVTCRSGQGAAFQESFSSEDHEIVRYDMSRLSPVRFLVFNNPYLQQILQTATSDAERWRAWLGRVQGKLQSQQDFAYLKERFDSFNELCRVVEFFQGTAVELHTNKRWTSRFLFPYGPNALYADLDGKGQGLGSNDRRFFARGGELLYLMLNRSGRGQELSDRIQEVLLNPENRWNRLVRALLPPQYDSQHDLIRDIEVGYLPYAHHRIYKQLAEDWLALLDLDVPSEALFDPLVRTTGLNLLLYLLEAGHAVAGERSEARIVLEIASPSRGDVFDLSKENYEANRDLPTRTLAAYLDRALEDPGWDEASRQRDAGAAAVRFLRERFHWNPSRDFRSPASPEKAYQAMREDAEKRHHQHFSKVLPVWSRQIGLSLARRRIGTWYAPNDAFLKALVLANVPTLEEFRIFLRRLYERYKIVVGPAEAERAYGALPTDFQEYAANATRLEMRLRALGLLDRLSDDCAYVRNPFHGGSR